MTEVIPHMAFQQTKAQNKHPTIQVVVIRLIAQMVLYKFSLMNKVR